VSSDAHESAHDEHDETFGDAYDERFMTRAIEIALANVASDRGGPFGAVIVRDGRIVAEAANRVVATNDPTAHAEVEAIRAACRALGSFELADCVLYASCEPCPMCLGAIYWARLSGVYFAATRDDAGEFDDAAIYREIARAPEERSIPMRRVRHAVAAEPFRRWAAKEDRARY
jgi:guanine deaminase